MFLVSHCEGPVDMEKSNFFDTNRAQLSQIVEIGKHQDPLEYMESLFMVMENELTSGRTNIVKDTFRCSLDKIYTCTKCGR